MSSSTTPTFGGNLSRRVEASSRKSPMQNTVRVTLPDSPLGQINTAQNSGNKRKIRASMSSLAKKRKENTEEINDKMPRRKLLFPAKFTANFPQEPLVALTPEDSPKKNKKAHPCFSQATVNPKSQLVQRQTYDENEIGSSENCLTSPRRDSLADFKILSVKRRNDSRASTATLVCTSIHSE